MQPALERALCALIVGPPVDPRDPEAIDAWLRTSGVSGEDAAAIRRAGIERLLVYRDLVRRTLSGVLETMLPRTVARLGPENYARCLDRFLADRGPRTHYLRDVTHEFVEHGAPLWRTDSTIEPYIADLARHEALEYEIAARQDEPAHAGEALALDRPVAFIRACALVTYDYAVHDLDSDVADRSLPAHRSTTLFAYRDAEHHVRFMELTALAGAIVHQLLEQRTLADAVARGAQSLGVAADPQVVEGLSRVLADLASRGVVLGAGSAAFR